MSSTTEAIGERLKATVWRANPARPAEPWQLVGSVWVVSGDIHGTQIRDEDHIVHFPGTIGPRKRMRKYFERAGLTELAFQVPRGEFLALRQALNQVELVMASWSHLGFRDSRPDFHRYLGHFSALNGNPATGKVWIVRPPAAIEADSDEDAIRRLIGDSTR